jgi:hypothetical protein
LVQCFAKVTKSSIEARSAPTPTRLTRLAGAPQLIVSIWYRSRVEQVSRQAGPRSPSIRSQAACRSAGTLPKLTANAPYLAAFVASSWNAIVSGCAASATTRTGDPSNECDLRLGDRCRRLPVLRAVDLAILPVGGARASKRLGLD